MLECLHLLWDTPSSRCFISVAEVKGVSAVACHHSPALTALSLACHSCCLSEKRLHYVPDMLIRSKARLPGHTKDIGARTIKASRVVEDSRLYALVTPSTYVNDLHGTM
ncbi:uncharacterized [Tachysurus ichikawai]